jgi:hypothetical protein
LLLFFLSSFLSPSCSITTITTTRKRTTISEVSQPSTIEQKTCIGIGSSTVLDSGQDKRWTCTLHTSTGQHTIMDQEIQSSFLFRVSGMRVWKSDVCLLHDWTAYFTDHEIQSLSSLLFAACTFGVAMSSRWLCFFPPRRAPARLLSCCDGALSSCLQNQRDELCFALYLTRLNPSGESVNSCIKVYPYLECVPRY